MTSGYDVGRIEALIAGLAAAIRTPETGPVSHLQIQEDMITNIDQLARQHGLRISELGPVEDGWLTVTIISISEKS